MGSILELILLFFLGASIASFFMCGRVGGRSKCDGCDKGLNWYELIPVVSWLGNYIFNKGKVKCCGQVLSWKYIFGEVILGLWFVGCYLYFDFNLHLNLFDFFYSILSLILGSVFFVLVMQDLDEMQVESQWLWVLMCLGILGCLINLELLPPYWEGQGWGPVLIFLPFWIIYFLGKYFDKQMIGEADPYVFTALGLFFGTQFSISLFLYSVWLGASLGIGYLILINKKLERNIRIPFLPIIFLACIIILVFNYHVIKIQDILLIDEILFQN